MISYIQNPVGITEAIIDLSDHRTCQMLISINGNCMSTAIATCDCVCVCVCVCACVCVCMCVCTVKI